MNKIELTREELTTILQAATGNVKDFVMNNDKFINEQLNLTDVVASLPSKDEKLIGNMCLSYRHDFGLLSEQEMNKLMNECKNWLISYENNRK